jgi:hypothetical protein
MFSDNVSVVRQIHKHDKRDGWKTVHDILLLLVLRFKLQEQLLLLQVDLVLGIP